MEIERKWMVTGWPEGLTQTSDYQMDQGYVSVRPTVRIRREALQGGRTALVLCFKGAGTLSREEIEAELRRNAETTATAFENQLDALYSAEAMDISTDIEVLDSILKSQNLAK